MSNTSEAHRAGETSMMSGSRRAMLATLAVGALGATRSFAQDFPTRPVRLVTPFEAGTIADVLARTVAQGLTAKWKHAVVVENRPGAGGIIGAAAVAGAAPDGHTLLMGTSGTQAINPSLHAKLPYDAAKGFAPIAQVATGYSLLVVHPSVPAKSVSELIAFAKAKPGQLSFGSGGIGTTPHLAGELFKSMTGVEINHVAYKGSASSVIDLLEGRIQMIFANVPSVQPHLQAGKLRVLGVTTPQRVAQFPEVPTISEAGVPGFAAELWLGLFAPAGTPARVVEQISQQVHTDLAQEAIVRSYAAKGVAIKTSSPAAFAGYVREETVKWAKVVKAAGAKAE
ncbi:MAG TPA: tripartite tricarboxylate transporter substrate binding protein [Ramlibacter sp.]|nr:tripartite tricarboxylate transporter substrate binding protein [Ramlibacter sp.]